MGQTLPGSQIFLGSFLKSRFSHLVLTCSVFSQGITHSDTLKGSDWDAWVMPGSICDTCPTLVYALNFMDFPHISIRKTKFRPNQTYYGFCSPAHEAIVTWTSQCSRFSLAFKARERALKGGFCQVKPKPLSKIHGQTMVRVTCQNLPCSPVCKKLHGNLFCTMSEF
jgi:hypothetical protein